MTSALTWDQPGLTFDSGLTWDAAASQPKRQAMNNTKASIDLSNFTNAELGPIAQTIHDQMDANAATFATPPVTMAALQTLITTYDAKLVARASNASADVLALNTAREELDEALRVLGHYVNGVAKGDATIVNQSGFPAYTTARTPDTTPPAAQQNLKLTQGELPGSLVARYKPDRKNSTNEVQTNTGDPNTESAWQTKGIFQGGKAELTGYTPGSLVWVRVRTVGLKGVMGTWSDPAQIRVI